jgi:MoxR-like ATPase
LSKVKLHAFTDDELRDEVSRLVKPLEEAAFAAGKRAAIAEQLEALRESAMLEMAQIRGLLPAGGAIVAIGKSPEELAKRANALQLQALAEGRKLSNIDSVKAAYAEAGIALK